MSERAYSPQTLGLDIDGKMLKGVAMTSIKGRPHVDEVFEFPYEYSEDSSAEGEHVKPLYIEAQKQRLATLLQKHLVVTALTTQDVLVRPLELKISKKKDIDAVLTFQAEPLLPYPIEDAVLDKTILHRSKEGCRLTIQAVKKEHLTEHLDAWKTLDIEPELISTAPQALTALANQFCAEENPFYAVFVGLSKSFCILIEQGKLIAAQVITGGVEDLAAALSEGLGLDSEKARLKLADPEFNIFQLEHPAVKSALENLRIHIARTVYALAKQIRGKEANTLLLTGPGAVISGFVDFVSRSLQKTALKLQENVISGISPTDLHQYALPLGAALNALPTEKFQVNFRQNEFAYPNPWKRLKRPMAIYILLCCVLAAVLVLFGQVYNRYKEDEIRYQYLDLLNVMNKPYGQFEKEFKAKTSPDQETGEIKELSLLNADEIKNRLTYLEKEIQATPQTYPLLPNIPLVSDVLAWLSTHPSFVGKQENDLLAPGLQIESFSYMLVKRPEPTKKQEKYQVKVELEFSSPTPKIAREFHDALIAPNEIVDAKGEIKWNSNKDRYRTSFYLKDKTIYTQQ